MIQFAFRLLIIYLVFKLISFLVSKAVFYYRAYKAIQSKKREQEVRRRREVNIGAFDIEDAKYEEIAPGQED